MTASLLRRRTAHRPRRVIESVGTYWRRDCAGVWVREVVVRVGGRRRIAYLPDEHPALVAFLARAAVAA